jgi:catechol 2,3-dioxygenase-like lactoylglutathione lyase family enzyme
MPETYKALYLSPMIPSYNIAATADFFVALFGFQTVRDDGNYVILFKDKLSIHLLNAGADIGQMEFYLVVDDIDKLWNSISNLVSGIKVRPPFDREYGMREFHIEVPHTNTLMFVGQVLTA